MAKALTHPVLAELRWESDHSWWSAEARLASGQQFGVIIELDEEDGDPPASIERAAELFGWAVGAEPGVLRDAVEQELLELYNGTWRVGGPELTADELAGSLTFCLLELDPRSGMIVPVSFHYEAAGLFGGHVVVVEVDQALRYRDSDLRG